MNLICTCQKCGRKFRTTEAALSKLSKCPECSGALQIVVAESSAPPKQATGDSAKTPPPVTAEPLDDSDNRAQPAVEPAQGLPHVVAGPSDHAGKHRPKSRAATAQKPSPQKSPMFWMATGIGAGALVAVLAVVGVMALMGGGDDPASSPAGSLAPVAQSPEEPETGPAPATTPDPPASDSAVLRIDLSGCEPGEVRVTVDGTPVEGSTDSTLRWEGRPGSHRLSILRRGYRPIDRVFELRGGDPQLFTPAWHEAEGPPEPPPAPVVDYSDWLQDLEAAKAEARSDGKNVLVLFNNSDGSEECARLAREVIFHPDLYDQLRKQAVLVHIDFPKAPGGATQVDDSMRNARLRAKYGVQSLPSLLLMDAEGHVLGAMRGVPGGGPKTFLPLFAEWELLGQRLQPLLAAIESSQGNARLSAIQRCLQLIDRARLLGFYQADIENWRLLAASGAEPPSTEPTPPPEPQPSEPPKEPEVPQPKTPLDKTTPEEYLAQLGLEKRDSDGFVLFAEEVEFARTVKQAEGMSRKTFQAEKDAQTAQEAVKQKEQMILAMLQRRGALRAQLTTKLNTDQWNATVTMLNQLGDQIAALEKSEEVEDRLEKVRGAAISAREEYVEHLLAAEKLGATLQRKYEAVEKIADVPRALKKLSSEGEKTYKLGPTLAFKSSQRRLTTAMGKVLSEAIPLRRGGGNLWMISVMLNGEHASEMAIDTGASIIALPWKTALAAGLNPSSDGREIQVQLADGSLVTAHKVTARTVRVGQFTEKDVECAVMPEEYTEAAPLLGLSFLGRFSYKIDTQKQQLLLHRIDIGE